MMAFKKNNPGCNASPGGCGCSTPTCEICEEVGAGSGCSISQVAGTVTDGGDFWVVTASNSKAISASTSGSEVEVRVYVRVIGSDDGDVARVFIKSNSDASTCYFAQLTFGTGATLKLFSRTAGVDTELATASVTAPAFEFAELHVCYGDGYLWARESVNHSGVSYALTTNVTTRPYAGFGTGSITSEVDFDNFRYSYGYSAGKTTCDNCVPTCELVDLGPLDDDGSGNPVGFTVLSGSWSVNQTTDADAMLMNSTAAPVGPPALGLSVQVVFGNNLLNDGDKIRLFLNVTDADNCWIAEFEQQSTTGIGCVKFFDKVGGVESLIGSQLFHPNALDTAIQNELFFCHSLETDRLVAGWTAKPLVPTKSLFVGIPAPSAPTATQTGVGTGDTMTGTFAIASYNVFRNGAGICPICEPCSYCDNTDGEFDDPSNLPDTVDVTISGVTNGTCGSCASLNGSYTLTRWGQMLIPSNEGIGCAWQYELPSSICGFRFLTVSVIKSTSGGTDKLVCDFAADMFGTTAAGSVPAIRWEVSRSDPFDCLGGSSHSLTSSTNDDCNASSASCSVQF